MPRNLIRRVEVLVPIDPSAAHGVARPGARLRSRRRRGRVGAPVRRQLGACRAARRVRPPPAGTHVPLDARTAAPGSRLTSIGAVGHAPGRAQFAGRTATVHLSFTRTGVRFTFAPYRARCRSERIRTDIREQSDEPTPKESPREQFQAPNLRGRHCARPRCRRLRQRRRQQRRRTSRERRACRHRCGRRHRRPAATDAPAGTDAPAHGSDGTGRQRAPAEAGSVSGSIAVSGSSTVEPISAAVGAAFSELNPDLAITVDGPGTGDGFAQFCAGEIDVSDASRPISEEEVADVRGIRHRLHRTQGRGRRTLRDHLGRGRGHHVPELRRSLRPARSGCHGHQQLGRRIGER